MQEHDNQILVPPSFIALSSDARGCLQVSHAQLCSRYELCEDLANTLVEQAQNLYHVQAPSEAQVLTLIHGGLSSPDAGLAAGEATWVVSRLAELLAWQCPELQAPLAPAQNSAS